MIHKPRHLYTEKQGGRLRKECVEQMRSDFHLWTGYLSQRNLGPCVQEGPLSSDSGQTMIAHVLFLPLEKYQQ